MDITDTAVSGHLILLVSVPGGGKSTLAAHLKEINTDVTYAVSCTSRPMRPGEKEGENYYFVTDEEFKQRIEKGEFLEWIQQDGGRYYGTLKSEITDRVQAGEVVLREVEIRGAEAIKQLVPKEALSVIFVTAGSWEEMEERIKKRAPISGEELVHRKERYERELLFEDKADYVIENRNGELEKAKVVFEKIVADIVAKTK